MPVVSVMPDADALTLTFVAQYHVPPERVWQVWADPRQLELWWGPPTWPATFTEHRLEPGGTSAYYMTGPEGDKSPGWWEFIACDPPHWLSFADGFTSQDGGRDLTMPVTRTEVTFEELGGGTRMTLVSAFASTAEMNQLVEMGVVEGMTEAMGQIDAVLTTPA